MDGVRLDSGDLAADARLCRAVLDEAGLTEARIRASGDLDEFKIAALVADGAPIDGYGVGTSIAVGAGDPERGIPGGALGTVYKEVWSEGSGAAAKVKAAGDKSTWPGVKQVYRSGAYDGDTIALAEELPPANAFPLLAPVLRGDEFLPGTSPPLPEIIAAARENLTQLPDRFHALENAPVYPVRFSDALVRLRDEAIAHYVSEFQVPGSTFQEARPHLER